MSFLHKGVSRIEAEELLLASAQDGNFLVRESESIPGTYTLCMFFKGRIHQYRILPDAHGLLSVEKWTMQAETGVTQKKYAEIAALIQDYASRGTNNGLITALGSPVLYEESDEDAYVSTPIGEQSFSYDAKVQRYLLQRFATIDMSNLDAQFIEQLRSYTERGALHDADKVKNNSEEVESLRQLVATAASQVNRELDNFFAKLDAMRLLFGPIQTSALCDPDNNNTHSYKEALNMNKIMQKLDNCANAIKNLERKAVKTFSDLTDDEVPATGDEPLVYSSKKLQRKDSLLFNIPSTAYEAKILRHGVDKLTAGSKVNLKVDIHNGKLFSIKQGKDHVLDATNVFDHDKISQLVKCTTHNNRLDVKIEGRKKETYMFDDARQRETFCQLVMQLKHQHATLAELHQLSLFIGTWNMGDEPVPRTFRSWLMAQGLGKTRDRALMLVPHDMYVVGTQESVAGKEEWVARLTATLESLSNDQWQVVSYASLWKIKLVVIVKSVYINMISRVQTSSVKTGIANTLGNKGAVGISFQINGTSMCFVNCHLTSGNEKNMRRVNNFRDIVKGLALGSRSLPGVDITNKFHHLFFLGDLNFRNDGHGMDPEDIIQKIQKRNIVDVLKYDQLKQSQAQKEAFIEFNEDPITFPPTYRLAKGTHAEYQWQKQKKGYIRINAPSWCDRVLWRSYPGTYIGCTSYGSPVDILCSDHRPVFATFDVGIAEQFPAAKAQQVALDISIVFETLQAKVRSVGRQSYKVEIISDCLAEPVMSKTNGSYEASDLAFCRPRWLSDQLPRIRPITDDLDYLEDQHLMFLLRLSDNSEPVGACVISLRGKVNQQSCDFSRMLIHGGEFVGELKGTLHIKQAVSVTRARRMRKSYDLVYTDVQLQEEGHKPPSGGSSASSSLHKAMSLEGTNTPPGGRRSFYENVSEQQTQPTSQSLRLDLRRRANERTATPEQSRRAVVGTRPKVSSVGELLLNLQLQKYTDSFLASGWDQLEFLSDLTERDLIDMDVADQTHRFQILQEVSTLKR